MKRRPTPTTLRSGFTLVELLVVMAIIAVLISLLLPAIQSIRERARVTECLANLKQLALACDSYRNTHLCYPTGYIDGIPSAGIDSVFQPQLRLPINNGTSFVMYPPTQGGVFSVSQWWGWHAFLLPNIEMQNVSPSFTHISGSNGLEKPQQDRLLMRTNIKVYLCPSASYNQNSERFAYSSYRGNLGSATDTSPMGTGGLLTDSNGNPLFMGGIMVSKDQQAVSDRDIQDGHSNTIMLAESLFSIWGDGYTCCSGERADRGTFDAPPPQNELVIGFGSWHKDICVVALCDGSARQVKKTIDRTTWRNALVRDDRQALGSDW